ncbi:succinate-semialdehyde dehydrogenase [Sarocladium strictum]
MASAFSLQDPSLIQGLNFVDGQWVPSASNKTFKVTDPAAGNILGEFPESTTEDTQSAIQAAATAFPAWRSKSGRERGRILRKWYDLVIENKQDLAKIITLENGKAKADGEGEVMFAASFLEWFSEEAPRIYGDVVPHSNSSFRVHVVREPVGVCGLITPWNFPAGMVTRKVAPALAAGCTVVLKSPGETPFSSTALAVLALRAGVPKGVFNIVSALENTPKIGHLLCTSPIIRKISFTGSTRVGRLLMSQSSDSIKKMSLELGGNAPFIVFDDADLDLALTHLVGAKFKVSGQTCVCANRIYIQKGVHDELLQRFVKAVQGFKIGPGAKAETTHGPLITEAAVDKVEGLVEDAVKQGAKVIVGGKRRPDIGSQFYEPTIITNVTNKMRIFHEEIFGPVATILPFDTEEEVVAAANNCDVGLASYLFTGDGQRAARVSEQLQAGMVAINTSAISDAPVPFGGIKQSGLGREGSKFGLEDYTELKSIITGNAQVIHRSHI